MGGGCGPTPHSRERSGQGQKESRGWGRLKREEEGDVKIYL